MATYNPVTFLKNAVQNAPWVVAAIAIHAIGIAIAFVIVISDDEKQVSEEIAEIKVSAPREELPEIEEEPEVIDRKAIPENQDAEIVTFEEDVYIPVDEAIPEDLHLDRGDPNSMDEESTGGQTGGTAIGVGVGGHHGLRPGMAGRKLGTMRRGRAGGPTEGTEKAVLEGLRWLIRHQNPDGSWSATDLKARCEGQKCYDEKEPYIEQTKVGQTALALLCFLGAGYSHESKQNIVDTVRGKRHLIGDVIKEGLKFLAKQQDADGKFSGNPTYMYNDALATMALAEAYGLTQNRYWKGPAQKGIDFLQKAQRPNPSNPQGLWGWRYAARQDVEDVRKSTGGDDAYQKELFDSDTSVTTWCVMALKSGQISGLEVKQESMDGAFEFIKWVTGDNGLVGYIDPKGAGSPVTGHNDHYTYHVAVMSALGMCSRIFVKHDPDDPFLDLASKRIVADLPVISKDKLSIDYYYWYYASLALNQYDGPDSPKKTNKYWGPWNKAMVDCVLEMQDKTEKACTRGGWIVPDRWAYHGGPIYGTAINVLTLEVYYRYDNAFGGAKRN